jgi:hypothetical protein
MLLTQGSNLTPFDSPSPQVWRGDRGGEVLGINLSGVHYDRPGLASLPAYGGQAGPPVNASQNRLNKVGQKNT